MCDQKHSTGQVVLTNPAGKPMDPSSMPGLQAAGGATFGWLAAVCMHVGSMLPSINSRQVLYVVHSCCVAQLPMHICVAGWRHSVMDHQSVIIGDRYRFHSGLGCHVYSCSTTHTTHTSVIVLTGPIGAHVLLCSLFKILHRTWSHDQGN